MSTNSPYAAASEMQPPAPAKDNTMKMILIILGVLFLFFVLCAGVLALLLWPAVGAARNAARRMQTQNNMRMIGLAFHNYHDVYAQFPPLYVTNSDGEPASSWRVSILPYIEEMSLDARWEAGERWNGDNNMPLLSETPTVYRMTADSQTGPHNGECHVFTIDDPRAALSGDKPRGIRDFTDGLSNTLMALYLPNRSVPWSAPNDLTVDEAFQEVSAASIESPVQILLCDGSVRVVTDPMDRATFEALVTRNGGEVIGF